MFQSLQDHKHTLIITIGPIQLTLQNSISLNNFPLSHLSSPHCPFLKLLLQNLLTLSRSPLSQQQLHSAAQQNMKFYKKQREDKERKTVFQAIIVFGIGRSYVINLNPQGIILNLLYMKKENPKHCFTVYLSVFTIFCPG